VSVEETVAVLLRHHKNQPYCDGCLGRLLQLGSGTNRHIAGHATRGLAAGRLFRRFDGRCYAMW
jgi:hypothetical protein